MSKLNRILVVAFLAQVLLLMGMRFGTEETAQRASSKVFDAVEPAKVTKIEILGEPRAEGDTTSPAQTSVALTKKGTEWGIASAEDYPADQTKVSELLEKLGKLKTRGPVVTQASSHRKLEVAEDKYQRKVTITHDGKDLVFLLGTSPSFKNVHLRKLGSDEVLQVGELTAWELGARSWDWVDRSYVKIPEKDVYALRVENKNGTIQLEKSADGRWTASGITQPLKQTVIDDLIRKASTLNLEEPVGKTEKPELGLDRPLATVTLTTGTSTVAGQRPEAMKTEVIKIGAKLEKENRYYAKATTSPYVVQVAGWAVEPLVSKGAKDLLEAPPAAEKKK